MGQFKTFCKNIMVTNTGNLCRYDMLKNFDFLGQYFSKMGHFKTFCKNIMVTNVENICRFDMVKIFDFLGQ
jgi:hypothetical protein